MKRTFAAVLLGASLAACSPVESSDKPAAKAPYDYLVLALSWSPSYCELEGERANRQQCRSDADHAFVVHGLWPQLNDRWPEFCPSREPDRVPESIVRQMSDIMPSGGLVGHQWRKHGSCTGLSQRGYFYLVREAASRVDIPTRFENARSDQNLSANDVEAAFTKANPGLNHDGIAVVCEDGYIREVRICLANDLTFRSCPQLDRRGCRLRQAEMPAPR